MNSEKQEVNRQQLAVWRKHKKVVFQWEGVRWVDLVGYRSLWTALETVGEYSRTNTAGRLKREEKFKRKRMQKADQERSKTAPKM